MTPALKDRQRFVDSWGEMGRIWGIPRTSARIHAFLLLASEPVSLDEITSRLGISKGGASSRLRELREWGMVRKADVPGDRRDFHVTEGDVWSAFIAMVRARKRREFEPATTRVKASLHRIRKGAGETLSARLGEMEEILDTLDGLGERLLNAGPATRSLLRFLAGLGGRSVRE